MNVTNGLQKLCEISILNKEILYEVLDSNILENMSLDSFTAMLLINPSMHTLGDQFFSSYTNNIVNTILDGLTSWRETDQLKLKEFEKLS